MPLSRAIPTARPSTGSHQVRLGFAQEECSCSSTCNIGRTNSDSFGVIMTNQPKSEHFKWCQSPHQHLKPLMWFWNTLKSDTQKQFSWYWEQLYLEDVLAGAVDLETTKNSIVEIMEFFLEASIQPHKFASSLKESPVCVPKESCSLDGVHKVLEVLKMGNWASFLESSPSILILWN